jgi:Ca2+-binding EF-hand superfamily protein
MRDVFRTLDVDGSGSLEITELETAMKSMGVDYSEKDMTNLIKQMDADGLFFTYFSHYLSLILLYLILKMKRWNMFKVFMNNVVHW